MSAMAAMTLGAGQLDSLYPDLDADYALAQAYEGSDDQRWHIVL